MYHENKLAGHRKIFPKEASYPVSAHPTENPRVAAHIWNGLMLFAQKAAVTEGSTDSLRLPNLAK